MRNIAQMLPKVRKSASGCSKCKIVLQTQKSAEKVLSAIGKGLVEVYQGINTDDVLFMFSFDFYVHLAGNSILESNTVKLPKKRLPESSDPPKVATSKVISLLTRINENYS